MPIGALSDFAHDFEFDLFCALWILRYRDRCNRFLSSHLFFLVPGGLVIVLFILDSPPLVLASDCVTEVTNLCPRGMTRKFETAETFEVTVVAHVLRVFIG